MRIPNITRWYLLLSLSVLGACHMARSSGTRAEGKQLDHEASAQLIEELEIGMHALRELGEDEALARLERIADGLRKERASAKKGKVRQDRRAEGKLEILDRRLEVLGYACDAYREAGKEDQAKQVARFLKIGEMQKAGVEPAELQKAFEGMSMGMVIELLQGASQLWEEWGWEGRAAACHGLAEYYARREREHAAQLPQVHEDETVHEHGVPKENEHGEPKEHDYGDLDTRAEILRVARKAHREAGNADAAALLEQAIHLAELQMEQADMQALARAQQGLSMEGIIKCVHRAAELWDEWGHESKARACRGLGEYYAQRDGIRPEREEVPDAHTQEIQKRMLELRKELEALNEKLQSLEER